MDPKSHRLYLSAATPAPTAGEKATTKGGGRRTYLPGSFVVLVIGD
jgi:hypothetical protein